MEQYINEEGKMEKSKIASKFYLDKEKDIVVNLIEEKADEYTKNQQ